MSVENIGLSGASMPAHASDEAATESGTPPAAPAPGQWILTQHWRGPVAQVVKVTPKRVTLDAGYIEPSDVKATFNTEEDANAGWARYRAVLKAGQDEMKVFEAARGGANSAYYAAERRLKAEAWSAALTRTGSRS